MDATTPRTSAIAGAGAVPDAGRRMPRRAALQLLVGAGAVALVGCSSDEGTTSAASSTSAVGDPGSTASSAGDTASTAAGAACEAIPEETAGPVPGDGTNGPDYLAMDGAVRRDIRSSLSRDEAVAGIPTTIELTVVDTADGCAPLAGAAVYAWHCDAAGRYSMYADGAEDETFCRGVQIADDRGHLSFTTVFPGCYPGRWPHVHLEVFRSVADATGGGRPLATSQLAFPTSACEAAYADDAYTGSAANLGRLSLDSDMVFADGVDDQLAAMSGDGTAGPTAALTVAV
jgi:protocatechuate 3,4-dioxygenase beta subunit